MSLPAASALFLGRVCGYGFFLGNIVLYRLIEIVTCGSRRGFYLRRERPGGGKDGRKAGKPQVEAADTRLSLLDLAIMDDRGYCVYAVT